VKTINIRPTNSAYMAMLRVIIANSARVEDRIWAREELATWEAAVDRATLTLGERELVIDELNTDARI